MTDPEELLCSKRLIKILKVLQRLGQLNSSDIAKRVNSNYAVTRTYLAALEKEGILLERMSGRVRFYRFNEHSPKAEALRLLIEAWGNQESMPITNEESL